jgi:hypothetical protein
MWGDVTLLGWSVTLLAMRGDAGFMRQPVTLAAAKGIAKFAT